MGPIYQPINVSNRPIAATLFSSPPIPGVVAGGLATAQSPGTQTLSGSAYVAPYAFAPSPSLGVIASDTAGLVTASSLLAAVALRRGQPQGPANDHEVEEFVYDALDLLPGTADVEVRCENGRATLSGVVQHKRTKRDIGEIAWAIPGLQDVQKQHLDYVAAKPRARRTRRRAAGRGVSSETGVRVVGIRSRPRPDR